MTDHRGARAPSFIRTPCRIAFQGNPNNYNTHTCDFKDFRARPGLNERPALLYWTGATLSPLTLPNRMNGTEALI